MKQDEVPDGIERFVACLPHVVPLANSVALGYNVFKTLPLLTIPYLPLRPLYELFRNVPAVSFGAVVLLLLLSTKPVGVEPRFLDLSSRLVRYNILQVRTVAAMQGCSSPEFHTVYWSDEAHSSEGPSLLRPSRCATLGSPNATRLIASVSATVVYWIFMRLWKKCTTL